MKKDENPWMERKDSTRLSQPRPSRALVPEHNVGSERKEEEKSLKVGGSSQGAGPILRELNSRGRPHLLFKGNPRFKEKKRRRERYLLWNWDGSSARRGGGSIWHHHRPKRRERGGRKHKIRSGSPDGEKVGHHWRGSKVKKKEGAY